MNLVENVLSTYRAAPNDYVKRGMDWYFHVNTLASDMGDVHTAAGVIAALSPNMPWDRNIMLATKAMANGHIDGGTFGQSINKANRIMAGEMPSSVLSNGKKGFKTLNFYRNISNPDNATPVTIDRHAYDIAVNIRHGKDYRPIGTSLKAYETYAQAYRDAANEVGIMPHQMQAITWEWYRSTLSSRRGVAA